MSGASRSSDGAAAFQTSSTREVGPPLGYSPARDWPGCGPSQALTYIGSGFTALPAAASSST